MKTYFLRWSFIESDINNTDIYYLYFYHYLYYYYYYRYYNSHHLYRPILVVEYFVSVFNRNFFICFSILTFFFFLYSHLRASFSLLLFTFLEIVAVPIQDNDSKNSNFLDIKDDLDMLEKRTYNLLQVTIYWYFPYFLKFFVHFWIPLYFKIYFFTTNFFLPLFMFFNF